MKILGIIPARYNSSRFPGKPLANILGKSMIRRVYEQASKAILTDLVVATDDSRIFDHVSEFGGKVMMTSDQHNSGTDRCAEVLADKQYNDFEAVINIQGDEPFILPEQINEVAELFQDPEIVIGTLVKKIDEASVLANPNIPKVVIEKFSGKALYFSRQQIPYCDPSMIKKFMEEGLFLKHIGIYGYRAIILPQLTHMAAGNLEVAEKLEQLRWLEGGFPIHTRKTVHENIAVDVPDDISRIVELYGQGS